MLENYKIFLLSNSFSWRLNNYNNNLSIQLLSIVICSTCLIYSYSLYSKNFIMSSCLLTKERSERFRKRFSQTSESNLSKLLSTASSFYKDDNKFFVETTMLYKIWKTRSLVLDQETNRLVEISRQQKNKIKELKVRLQAKKNTSSSFIYFKYSRS